MTILSVSTVDPAPIPSDRKPGFRANPPTREARSTAQVAGWRVSYIGPLPTDAEVTAWLAAKQSEQSRADSFDQAIGNFSFGGQTIGSLKAMSNAEFDTWWDANVDSLPKAMTVLKLLTRAALRRLL